MKGIKFLVISISILFSSMTLQNLSSSITINLESIHVQNDSTSMAVGEFYGGGIIFYVDQSGKHGLICSMTDMSMRRIASDNTFEHELEMQSTEEDLYEKFYYHYNGENTKKVCEDYINPDFGTGIYSDWKLPTIVELERLYNAKSEVNIAIELYGKNHAESLTNIRYWSSTRYIREPIYSWWLLNFSNGNRVTVEGRVPNQGVRAIRTF